MMARGRYSVCAVLACCAVQLGCTPRALDLPEDIGVEPNFDFSAFDGSDFAIASCANPLPPDDGCGPTELCGPDGTGNGLDDNCNGVVDEACVCTPGNVESCFVGPPGKRDVGACTDGTQTCHGTQSGSWGACTGSIGPTPEVCDGLDNDCNGCVDDGLTCTGSKLECPSTVPDVLPFTTVSYPGHTYLTGAVSSWSWTVQGGPCDQLFQTTTGNPPSQSFTLGGTSTATPSAIFSLSGDYTVVMSAVSGGVEQTCKFVQHVVGPGVRFELCWDTTGESDLDLHVHQPNTKTNFFGPNINRDDAWPVDCDYTNCNAASTSALPSWGYAHSALSNCVGGPEGTSWAQFGFCNNPRLDIDNITDVGVPENANIDNPHNGDSFRALVHYYGVLNASGVLLSHPMVNIYCGGHIKATYGQAPDVVPSFQTSGGWAMGNMWRVADVVAIVDGSGVTTDCTVTALHPGSATTGYRVGSNNSITFEGQ
jgi:uncharacterized protein YfaP (DUF2135 family)